MKTLGKILIINLIVLTCFFGTERKVKAATITVDNGTSTVASDGECSLREAIENANDDAATNSDCTAGSGTDTIDIQTDIVLTTADHQEGGTTNFATPQVTDSIIIAGNDHTISRSGATDMQFILLTGGDIDLSISDLTISDFSLNAGANYDGAVDLHGAGAGTLDLDNVTFSGNTGGVIHSGMGGGDGEWTITDSTFTNNSVSGGGGIINSAPARNLTVTDSTFSGNSSSNGVDGASITFLDGGGPAGPYTVAITGSTFSSNTNTFGCAGALGISTYFSQLTINIINSTFESNIAATCGGALSIEGGTNGNLALNIVKSTFKNNTANGTSTQNGGAIYIQDEVDVTLVDVTFSGNTSLGSAGGGALHMDAGDNSLTASFDTFYNNSVSSGAGNDFYQVGTSSSTSLAENNIFASGGDECGGTLTQYTFTNNLSSDSDCGSLGAATGLSAISDNGGVVETIALSSGSNAVDTAVAGSLGCYATDARGITRPFGAACDIGAFEYVEGDISLSESDGSTSVSESGTTDSYTVVLTRVPIENVTVSLSYDSTFLSASPSSLVFTTSTWSTPQTVTITPNHVDTNIQDQTVSISHSAASIDPAYDNASASVSVTVLNIDSGTVSSGSGGGGNPNPPPAPVLGCTDSMATNYNANATADNGSCVYSVLGCTDSTATNYSSAATQNDGSCTYPVLGCTDSTATDYNANATQDNGSCTYPPPPVPEEPLPVEPTPETPNPAPNDQNPNQPPSNNNNNNSQNLPSNNNSKSAGDSIKAATQAVRDLVNEIPKSTKDTVSTAGIIVPIITFAATQPAAAASIPIRLWNLIPTLFGLRRKKRPWGTVYDSVTKQPLDPVYVTLETPGGKEVATTITDIDGRFGFLVAPGRYRIKAHKDNYTFPSQKMFGKNTDELYNNLYFSEDVEVTQQDELLVRNIPMDALNFNWNEFEKAKNKKLMKFYSKRDLFFAHIASIAFIGGLVSSVVLLLTGPTPLNFVMIGIYAVVLVLRAFGVKPKKPGYIIEKETGFPLSFGLVKVFSTALGKEVAHSVIGKTGKYYTLVPNGDYFLKVFKKSGEDSYEEVYAGEPFEVKHGFINKKLKI